MKILIINGCNLNFLGIREPEIYGNQSYQELTKQIKKYAKEQNIKIQIFQSNYEGAIVDVIQKAYYKHYDGIIINPGAFTHYSIAIRDAIKSVNIPTIEVHLTDISKREDFRRQSVISDVCQETIMGKMSAGYLEAIDLFKGGKFNA